MPCWVLKCIPSLVKALWFTIFSAFLTSINRSLLGLPAIRFLIIVFHRVTFPFMRSAIGGPASGFRGLVHKATNLGLYFSFNSLRRQTNNWSHFASGVTGFLDTSFAYIIKVSVSTRSSFCSSIILITKATETPPKEITVVWPTTRISFKSITRLSNMIWCWLSGHLLVDCRRVPGHAVQTGPWVFCGNLNEGSLGVEILTDVDHSRPDFGSTRYRTGWFCGIHYPVSSRRVSCLHAEKERSYPSYCPVIGVSCIKALATCSNFT